jgi:hypothetical protein
MAEINPHLFAILLSSTVELAAPPQLYDVGMKDSNSAVHKMRLVPQD